MNNMKKWMRIGNHTWAMVGPCSGNSKAMFGQWNYKRSGKEIEFNVKM